MTTPVHEAFDLLHETRELLVEVTMKNKFDVQVIKGMHRLLDDMVLFLSSINIAYPSTQLPKRRKQNEILEHVNKALISMKTLFTDMNSARKTPWPIRNFAAYVGSVLLLSFLLFCI